jgi:putative SbcD/Mre11-related phosphoesterase
MLVDDLNQVTIKGYRVNDEMELYPGGAVLLTSENVLVVADLHLGCEAALEYEGLSIPRVQANKIEQYLRRTIEQISPRKLIIAGDFKHNFSRNLVQEWNDVSRFVAELRRLVPIDAIKGNHDNYLGVILSKYGVPFHKELLIRGIRVAHGHSGVRRRCSTVIGHIHPSIRIRDGVGASVKDVCFLYDPGSEMLVLPALSLVASGLDVVRRVDSDQASPLLPETGLSSFLPIVFAQEKPLKFPPIGKLRELNQET